MVRQKSTTSSKLTIFNMRYSDAGFYECRVEGFQPHSLTASEELKELFLSLSLRDSVSLTMIGICMEQIKKKFFFTR